ncbi:Alpha-ketoglutarate-dependent dioxygenase alkB-like protein 6, partial [Acropora cervicornis]
TYVNKVVALQVFDDIKPNHVLVNEYKPGQGIMRVGNLESCNCAIGDTLQRATRISLTVRNVPKIVKFRLNLGR